MKPSITIVIISLVFICTVSYVAVANTTAPTNDKSPTTNDDVVVRMVDVTPKDWRGTVIAIFTIVLAIFTGALVWATIVYVRRTGENVKVSRELLDSNKVHYKPTYWRELGISM